MCKLLDCIRHCLIWLLTSCCNYLKAICCLLGTAKMIYTNSLPCIMPDKPDCQLAGQFLAGRQDSSTTSTGLLTDHPLLLWLQVRHLLEEVAAAAAPVVGLGAGLVQQPLTPVAPTVKPSPERQQQQPQQQQQSSSNEPDAVVRLADPVVRG